MSTTPTDDYAPEVWPPQDAEQLVTAAYCYWARLTAWGRAEIRNEQFLLGMQIFDSASVWLVLGNLVDLLRQLDPATAGALLERMRPLFADDDLEWVEEVAAVHLRSVGVDVDRLIQASSPPAPRPGVATPGQARQQIARHVLATADQPGVDRHLDYPELSDAEWAQVAALVADLRQALLPEHDEYDAAIAVLSGHPTQEQ